MGLPRLQRVGTAWDMIARVMRAVAQEDVTELTGATVSTQSHWQDPEERQRVRMPVVHLHRLARVCPEVARIVARHFAAMAGCRVVEMAPDDRTLPTLVANLHRAEAELTGVMLDALDPAGPGGSELTPNELGRLQGHFEAISEIVASAQARLTQEASR